MQSKIGVCCVAVPVSNAVAGVACGLVCKESDNGDIEEFKLLTDITVGVVYD